MICAGSGISVFRSGSMAFATLSAVVLFLLPAVICAKKETANVVYENPVPKMNQCLSKKDSLILAVNSAVDDTTKINALLSLCDYLLMRTGPDEVLPYAKRARSITDSLLAQPGGNITNLKKNKARVLSIIGALSLKTGNYDEAIKLQQEALEIYQQVKYQKGIATIYHNLGFIYTKKAEFPKALEFQLKSLQIREKSRDSMDIAYSFYNLGMLYHFTGNEKLAIKYSLDGLQIREIIKDQYGIAGSLVGLGNIYFGNKKVDKALEFYRKAYSVNKTLGHSEVEAALALNIGNIFYEEDQLDSATAYYQKALVLFRQRKDGIGYAKASINLSGIHYATGKYKYAKEIILQNIDSIKKYQAGPSLEDVYERLIKCDSALGNSTEALRYSRLKTEIARKNEADKATAQVTELQNKFDLEKKEDENKALLHQNKIQSLEINRGRLIAVLGSVLLIFSIAFFFFLFLRYKYKAEGETIRLQQKLLRTQMNPHFIFNCLQAIQNYIRKNKPQESAEYLNSFASLTRDVLENSRAELISLEKELNLLKNYLDLQKLRFEERFDYEIHVQRNLNISSIFLPPMLSQPFIENSIEHGFNDMESGGKVEVYFQVENDSLLMDIVDNGKGIDETAGHKDHSSLALEITKERIDLLNKKRGRASTFHIGPAHPENPDMKGVRVSFVIPFVDKS
jgi:tetratricopeptide (TPR) repeat protein